MIEYLEINGQKYPVRIGYLVMKNIKAETGLSFNKALKKSREEEDLSVYESILFYALQMGAYADTGKTDIPFEREDMPMILDLVLFKFLPLFHSEKFMPPEAEEAGDKPEKKRKPPRPMKKK